MVSRRDGGSSLSFHLKLCFHQGGRMFEMRWWGVKGSFKNIFHKITSKE